MMVWTPDLLETILADTVTHSGAITEGITVADTLPIPPLADQVHNGQTLNPCHLQLM
jgi:hypothetical protein